MSQFMNKPSLTEKITQITKRQNWPRKAIANHLGISKTYLCQIEHHVRPCPPAVAKAIDELIESLSRAVKL